MHWLRLELNQMRTAAQKLRTVQKKLEDVARERDAVRNILKCEREKVAELQAFKDACRCRSFGHAHQGIMLIHVNTC